MRVKAYTGKHQPTVEALVLWRLEARANDVNHTG